MPLHLSASRSSLIHYSLVIFLIFVAESIMSYLAPIYIQGTFNNSLITGLLLSLSSLVGFVADIILGELFKNKTYFHFVIWGCLFSLLFPLSMLLFPPLITFLIISMTIWGIYYELISFSSYHFIHHDLPHQDHTFGWSIINSFRDSASLVGPLLASFLIGISINRALIIALGFYLAAMIGFLLFLKVRPNRHPNPTPPDPHLSFREEFAVWRLILPKIWPIIFLIITLNMFDAAIWSIGAILSEQFKSDSIIGGLLVAAYLLPSLMSGLIFSRFPQVKGKKRRAFKLGIAAGLVYIATGFIRSPLAFMAAIFVASLLSSTLWPLILGVIEDYVERLGNYSNLMVSLQNSTLSLAYILGTAIAGLIAYRLGEQFTFSIMGSFIFIAAIVGLITMPKKVRLPQKEIHSL